MIDTSLSGVGHDIVPPLSLEESSPNTVRLRWVRQADNIYGTPPPETAFSHFKVTSFFFCRDKSNIGLGPFVQSEKQTNKLTKTFSILSFSLR
jgi:hypothetical protein